MKEMKIYETPKCEIQHFEFEDICALSTTLQYSETGNSGASWDISSALEL